MRPSLARRMLICAVVVLPVLPLAAQVQTESFRGRPVAASEVLVRFKSITPNKLTQAQQALDADTPRPVGGVPRLFRFHSRSQGVAALVKHFRGRPNVLYAEPNFIVKLSKTPNDPSFPQLWGLQNTGQAIGFLPGTPGADIGAAAAWDITTGSTRTAVAVVDTGVDYRHADLAANAWSAPAPFSVTVGGTTVSCAAGSHGFNVLTGSCDPMDDHGHGTHVSGTIGAAGNNGAGVVGVNWTTQILGVKFLDASGSGTYADAANAIEFAIQVRLTLGVSVRVLNASWGGPDFSQALLDELQRAAGNDMLFVAAAGNNGANNDTTAQYPANYALANIIAVAATDNTDDLAYFSDYGATTVHLGAPGVNIYSTLPSGSYGYESGTSMAAPHVAGAAALLLAVCSKDTASLKSALLNNVDLLPSLTGMTITGGRLNVARALHSCTDPVVLSPGSASFGNQVLFATSAPQTLTLTNNQAAPVTIAGIQAGGDFAQTNDCGTSVPPGGHCSIQVTFTPSAAGSRSGTLTVSDSASNSPQTAGLAGLGIQPVTVTPTALLFGSTVVGTSSAPQIVTLTNNQAGALAVSGVATSGDYTQTNDCGTSLPAQRSCRITVTFTPTVAGSRPGTLSITDDAATSPQSVTLSGLAKAQVTLSPTALVFGSTAVGSTSTASAITLTNNQSATALAIGSIVATGDFAQTNDCGTSVAPLGRCTIRVLFTPTVTGSRSGVLTVTDNAGNSPQTATLSGYAVAPVTLSTTLLFFSSTALGSTSAAQSVTLTNNQNAAAVNISGITVIGDFAQTNTCGATLAPLAKCSITVSFTPAATGTRSGVLTVTDDAANSPQTLKLSGNGVPQATLSAAALNLGSVAVGSTGAAQNITLTNNQNAAALTVAGIATSGDFAQTSNCGSSLAPLAKCTITVSFTPTATGSRTGTLTVSDSASNTPQSANLSGTGLAQASLSPTLLFFGSVAVGSTGTAQSVTLTNNQNAATLTLGGISATGDFAQMNNCGTALAPLAKCTITVTFRPTATGTRTGTLSVTDTASNSPQTASLNGSGIAQATLSTTALVFSTTAVGTTATAKTVTLTNNQNAAALAIGALTATGDLAQTNNCGTSLAPLAKCTISVTFTPTATGYRTGTITVTDSATNSPQVITCSGSGQ